jgi:opacity protein-like surface antigen
MRCFLLILGGAYFLTAFCAHSQESTGRLSVAPLATAPAASPAPATTPAPTPTQQPVAKAPEPTSNVVDAPLPEVANQPKVITPSQTSSPDGPKGPRDGHWYIGASAGASLQQFQSEGSVTAIGYPTLEVNSNPRIGLVVSGKVGYEFATRDVQLAFGGPIPMKTALEFDMTYFAYRLKQPVTATGGGNVLGYENGQMSGWVPCLNGLIKFEELPVVPYFGGGIGAGILNCNSHVLNYDQSGVQVVTADTNATNTVLALQAIVGLETHLTEQLRIFVEYKFLGLMDVQFAYGNNSAVTNPGNGGSNSSNNYLAQQIVQAGLKWDF